MTTGSELDDGTTVDLDQVLARLHDLVQQPLLAAERALQEGDTATTTDLLRLASVRLEAIHEPAIGHGDRLDDIVHQAVTEVRTVWGDQLALRLQKVDRCGDALPRKTGAVLARCLQELLTNAAKHSPDVPVRVVVACCEDWVRLTVAQRTSTQTPAIVDSAGSGLRSLQSAVELHGGEFTAHLDDGVLARVRLPRRESNPA